MGTWLAGWCSGHFMLWPLLWLMIRCSSFDPMVYMFSSVCLCALFEVRFVANTNVDVDNVADDDDDDDGMMRRQ